MSFKIKATKKEQMIKKFFLPFVDSTAGESGGGGREESFHCSAAGKLRGRCCGLRCMSSSGSRGRLVPAAVDGGEAESCKRSTWRLRGPPLPKLPGAAGSGAGEGRRHRSAGAAAGGAGSAHIDAQVLPWLKGPSAVPLAAHFPTRV